MSLHSDAAQKYVLGIDLGIASLGWALVGLDDSDQPASLIGAGVRIYQPGVDGTVLEIQEGKDKPKASDRYLARHHRRQLRRRAYRQQQLYKLLERQGLLPMEASEISKSPSRQRHDVLTSLDLDICQKWRATATTPKITILPLYQLRKRALDEKLEPYEIGRILYHLSQRRGFRSNRKNHGSKSNEERDVAELEIEELSDKMAQSSARTLGEYLAGLNPHQIGQNVRRRCAARKMYEDEFDLIWKQQSNYYPQLLTDTLRRKIVYLLFFQRQIAAQSHFVGHCALEGRGHRRAAWATLEAQRFRLIQNVNGLKVFDKASATGRQLNQAEKKLVFELLDREGNQTFIDLRKALNFDRRSEFNLELNGLKQMLGNSTNQAMLSVFGQSWDSFSDDDRKRIVEEWRTITSETGLIRRGQEHWGLDEVAARKWAAALPENGYCTLSRKALNRLLPLMLEGMSFREAGTQEYGHFCSDQPILDELPPLCVHRKLSSSAEVDKLLASLRLDTVGNTAIKRALVELRKVVNAIVRKHGKPYEVRVELDRELRSTRKERNQFACRNRERETERNRIKQHLQSEYGIQKPSRSDIEKALLHAECGGICPFTGKPIMLSNLFEDSPQFVVEHIIPLNRFPEDSFQNKTLCWHEESRNKHNKTPFEAYARDPTRWTQMLLRIQAWRPRNPGKIKRFTQGNKDKLFDFVLSQIIDRQYASTLTCRFLGSLYGGYKSQIASPASQVIFASSGAVTPTLRRAWGLESILRETRSESNELVKAPPRADHRYHAIDAITIAATRNAIIQSMADMPSVDEDLDFCPSSPRIFRHPWPNFLDSVRPHINSLVVSHRPEHKMSGLLHEATNYGPPFSFNGKMLVHVRKPVPDLTLKDIASIADPAVRVAVQRKAEILDGDLTRCAFTSNWPTLTTRAGSSVPIKRVRILKVLSVIPISSGERLRFVAPTKSHHTEIYSLMRDDGEIEWRGIPVTLYEASERKRKGHNIISHEHPAGEPWRFKFSLMGGDTIELHRRCMHDKNNCVPEIYQVRAIAQSGQLGLVKVSDARSVKDIKAAKQWWAPRAELLRKLGCRKVSIDPLGRVYKAND